MICNKTLLLWFSFKNGKIQQYNDKLDYINPRQAVPLKVEEKMGFLNYITTFEESFADIIQGNKELNVFASDAVIATLMTSPLSVYPWDISATKVDGKLILEYNDKRLFDYITTYESANVPPEENLKAKTLSVNGPKKLSIEATMSNHYFAQQALIPNTDVALGPDYSFIVKTPLKPKKGFLYRMWELDKDIKLCVRCQVDGYINIQVSEAKLRVEAENKEIMEKEKKEKKDKKESERKTHKKSEEEKKQPESAEPPIEEIKKIEKAEERPKVEMALINLKALNEYHPAKRVYQFIINK